MYRCKKEDEKMSGNNLTKTNGFIKTVDYVENIEMLWISLYLLFADYI